MKSGSSGQARLALQTPSGDYDSYLARWLSQYAEQGTEIAHCCGELASSAAPLSSDIAIDRETRQLARVSDGFSDGFMTSTYGKSVDQL
jgi:hypothetical protein